MKLSWLPGSYKAAVSITDDPDNGSLPRFKAIYDFLMEINFPTTELCGYIPKQNILAHHL